MSFLRLLFWHIWLLLSFSSGEIVMCECCSFLLAAESDSSRFSGETDLKSEQNAGARGSALPFSTEGEITCPRVEPLLKRTFSGHVFV